VGQQPAEPGCPPDGRRPQRPAARVRRRHDAQAHEHGQRRPGHIEVEVDGAVQERAARAGVARQDQGAVRFAPAGRIGHQAVGHPRDAPQEPEQQRQPGWPEFDQDLEIVVVGVPLGRARQRRVTVRRIRQVVRLEAEPEREGVDGHPERAVPIDEPVFRRCPLPARKPAEEPAAQLRPGLEQGEHGGQDQHQRPDQHARPGPGPPPEPREIPEEGEHSRGPGEPGPVGTGEHERGGEHGRNEAQDEPGEHPASGQRQGDRQWQDGDEEPGEGVGRDEDGVGPGDPPLDEVAPHEHGLKNAQRRQDDAQDEEGGAQSPGVDGLTELPHHQQERYGTRQHRRQAGQGDEAVDRPSHSGSGQTEEQQEREEGRAGRHASLGRRINRPARQRRPQDERRDGHRGDGD